ncbi:hypothetical protein GUJ93_ZPchr0012g21805 [Zizania palustris]|uniref:Uncharacterized protein n=1 Tax=Zizania palustris TaxID=103762 RepID=A0A8J5WPY4_ZIZPA|nr:hypothetical protein GUJ93_ZPchr0012g21805 [Zizania palustris]
MNGWRRRSMDVWSAGRSAIKRRRPDDVELRLSGVLTTTTTRAVESAEGLLAIAQDEKMAVVVELNRETDFVARNDVFQYLRATGSQL